MGWERNSGREGIPSGRHVSCRCWGNLLPECSLPLSRTLGGWKELLSVGSLSWDMCLPRLGTEPRDIGQAAGREVIEEASVSSLWVTGLLTASSCCVTLCELLTL